MFFSFFSTINKVMKKNSCICVNLYFRTAKLIMREMIQTERDYVKALEYVIEVSVFFITFPSITVICTAEVR